MIINLRGTSGSGKSTIARAVLAAYPRRSRVMIEGRKQPIGYVLNRAEGRALYVPGHYETDCGGCDTITKMDDIFDHVQKAANMGMDVFFEGLLISAEFNRTLELRQKYGRENVLVVGIDIPLEECLAGVNGRRAAALARRQKAIAEQNRALAEAGRKLRPEPNDRGEVNPRNTESKWKATRSVIAKLAAADVDTFLGTRAQVQALVFDALGLDKEGAQEGTVV